MAEYTDAFAHFIIECTAECKGAYDDLCDRIENGEVPADTAATVRITVPASFVDEIRAERLVLMANGDGDG